MSIWTFVGWTLIAVAGLGLARRRRHRGVRPRVVPPSLVREIRIRLAERHPDVAWRGTLPGTLAAVLEIDGQETAVPLQRFLAQVEAFPAAVEALVDRLVDEVRSEALEMPERHAFGDVASAILPQVRRVDWIDGRGGRFGDSALARRSLGADLAVCYVIDGPDAMTFVCRRHLGLWDRSVEELDRLAVSNLRRLSGTRRLGPGPGGEPLLVHRGDGYDAARMLLMDPIGSEGVLVALPERDLLWLGNSETADLAELTKRTAEQSARSSRPVSDRVYIVRRGQLETLGDPATGSPAAAP